MILKLHDYKSLYYHYPKHSDVDTDADATRTTNEKEWTLFDAALKNKNSEKY